ncbi:LysR family transcriptional regulator [Acinetobacter qingfengensis]|uniref:LysR family transcriptional regulator n=1 Tax=Acinetobacter qingfengensis TaxID=1262585 RepID=A0A1E7RCM9_9GAMM|nr:LysR family transcriptional regulator [Acinetobacter qingfengensis]KAA8735247.1 LysR family transcriptional regulator [Acinetobacter qingfengensis]OEY96977.1 LysR family transcriptional regulator [Acinetobacter qingfengensis]
MVQSNFPDLKLLQIFVTVVKNQGFANSQHELNLSTSAISTYMSQLESNVGMKLCSRGRGGFALTTKGELFYQEALRILQELDKFSIYTAQIKGELNGTIKIGIIDSIITENNFSIDQVIGLFSQENPHVYIRLQVQSPYELQMGILENRFDVAIGSFFTKVSGIIYQPIYQEQHWLFCSDKHAFFSQRHLTEGQVTQEKMVRRGYWSHHELAKHGFKNSSATVESMEAQLILILTGQYIGYLPEHYAQHWVDQGRLKVLLPSIFGYRAPFSVISRRGRTKELFIQKFRDVVAHTSKIKTSLARSI